MADQIEVKDVLASIEGVNRAFEEFKKSNDAELKLKADGKSVDVLIEEKSATINAEISKQQETIDAFILSQKRKSRALLDENGNEIDLDKKAADWITASTGDRSRVATGEQLGEYKSVFGSFLRKGDRVMEGVELKTLSVGSDPAGGYQVHPDTSGQVVTQIFETSPMRAYASSQTISTDALEGTVDDDEAAATWADESSSRSTTDTPDQGMWRIPAHEIYANPDATQKLLDDAAVDMEAWLAGKVADAFARAENTAFVNGDGVKRPRGFLTYGDYASAGVYERGAIEQFDTGANGAFVAAPNGGDVLIKATNQLKAGYRANANWFMGKGAAELARKLKDSDGAYLWQNGIALGQPASLLGYSVAAFEDMPTPATGSLSIAFGDMRATYQIVDRMGIRVLRDPFTATPKVIFKTTKRTGGDVVNFESMKLIKFAA
jgi:HK97 family phage major capsid protein